MTVKEGLPFPKQSFFVLLAEEEVNRKKLTPLFLLRRERFVVENNKLSIVYVPVNSIKFAEYNPRKWSSESKETLRKSIEENGFVDPVILNSAPERMDVLIGGNFMSRPPKF